MRTVTGEFNNRAASKRIWVVPELHSA